AVWLSGGGAPAPAPATPLLAFDPARVSAIEVTDARGTHRVRREPSGEWIYDGGFAWPALIPADAQRALGELSSLERSDEAAGDEAPASTLRLRMDDGSERAIEALPGSLGGMTTIRVRSGEGSPGAGRIATTTLNALIDPGPAGWRAPM